MFPKPHHQPPPHSQPFPHSLSIAATPTRHSPTAGDDDASHGRGPSPLAHSMLPGEPVSGDGATIEAVRRPRGRPPGSKNKPKPPVVITRDAEPAMSPYILEVPGGSDVVEAIARFCRRKNTGLCVLTGYGTVSNVTLRQPSSTPGATVTFHGHFDIISVCATFLPHTASFPVPNGFTITLAGPQGQIFGGLVAGALVTAGTVYVIAASFNNPSYQRLPSEGEVRKSASGDVEEGRHSPSISGGKDSESHAAAVEPCALPVYSSHISSDVIWAPTARQPPPHHRPY